MSSKRNTPDRNSFLEGKVMQQNFTQLYDELQMMKKELLMSQHNRKQSTDIISQFIIEELSDIEEAIKKLENGTFGNCEFSGEQLPSEYICVIPTIKTEDDMIAIQQFFRKTMYAYDQDVF